jgi:hypothetical protein
MNFSLPSYIYLGSWQIISFGKKILGTVGDVLSTCLVDVKQKGQDRKRMIIALSPLALITKKRMERKKIRESRSRSRRDAESLVYLNFWGLDN